ncbi:MAG: glycine cleavage system protein GcvH [Methylobacterium sp.]|nr:glycine cleavage system protein GcvH [Methylobacterium sp.]
MNIPESLKFSDQHLWVSIESPDSVACGITDHAQDTLGDIVFIEAPAIGTQLSMGQPCGIVESVKTASDLHAPVTGIVTGINQDLLAAPEQANVTPYSAWIFKLKPAHSAELDQLLDAKAYRKLLDA